jgi:hypothetical protein
MGTGKGPGGAGFLRQGHSVWTKVMVLSMLDLSAHLTENEMI